MSLIVNYFMHLSTDANPFFNFSSVTPAKASRPKLKLQKGRIRRMEESWTFLVMMNY